MPFEHRIRELCEQLADCRDDAAALRLAQELQALLHERIEQLRGHVSSLPLLKQTCARRLRGPTGSLVPFFLTLFLSVGYLLP